VSAGNEGTRLDAVRMAKGRSRHTFQPERTESAANTQQFALARDSFLQRWRHRSLNETKLIVADECPHIGRTMLGRSVSRRRTATVFQAGDERAMSLPSLCMTWVRRMRIGDEESYKFAATGKADYPMVRGRRKEAARGVFGVHTLGTPKGDPK